MRTFGKAESGFVPAARVTGLVSSDADDGVMVYDMAVHHIHHLNRVSATIWRRCDGRRSVGDLARRATIDLGEVIDEAVVRQALTRLGDVDLLDGPLPAEMRIAASSRRTLMKRLATASAVPVIVSMSAPTAAMASSHCVGSGVAPAGTGCNQDAQCCSGTCGNRQFAWQMGNCT